METIPDDEPPLYLPPTLETNEALAQHHRVIIIPSGRCPVKLHDLADIDEWIDNLITYGLKHGMIYSLDAIKYFLRKYVDINTPEFKVYCNKIDMHAFIHYEPEPSEPEEPDQTVV